jgi:hypothetical protein
VQPVSVPMFLMGIAETYDLLMTIPKSGQHELRFTTQDGSGHSSALFGNRRDSRRAHDRPDPIFIKWMRCSISLSKSKKTIRAPR